MKDTIWKILCFTLLIIIIILISIIIKSNNNLVNKSNENEINNTIQEQDVLDNRVSLHLSEDLFKDGIVEGIENLSWNTATILHNNNIMEIIITLNNESETEKIPKNNLKINLLDQNGIIIYSKEATMEEISANYGYTTIDLEFESIEPKIIYDIQIISK